LLLLLLLLLLPGHAARVAADLQTGF